MPKAVFLLSDNDLARAYHALTVAITARSAGYDVYLFTTGLGIYIFSRRPRTRLIGIPALARWYVARSLKRLGAKPLEELARDALKMGIVVYVDEPVAKMLGVEPIEGVKYAGALSFLALSKDADLVLTF
ncbi:MAG: DsrE family protein [Thermoproteus sp.]|jgi:Predicted peroxiredoxins|nr:MAG: peroxiredoxin [Thermoproteus sp. CIS_19]KUO88826.1 MAG: peroxiredoxin [Thermoproteus sp. JCHS_4]MDT7869826.1 DsrE family protein [Thermoproteus sp.]MDT7882253.1 DsrE family protein [Thermoproteus sp.]